MPSSLLTISTHAKPLNSSIFPSLIHLPEDLDSYAVNTWIRTGYWPWMSESFPQIPANTSARLVKTSMDEVSLPAILDQGSSILKRKRSISASKGSTVALHQQFRHLSREYGSFAEGEAEDDAIGTLEDRTESPTLQAPVLEKDEVEEKYKTPLIQAARSVSLASTAEKLGQNLQQPAAGISTFSEKTAEDASIKREEARTLSLVPSAADLEENKIEKQSQPPTPKSRMIIPPSKASTKLSLESIAPIESRSSVSFENSTYAADLSIVTMERIASRRQLLSALTFQSLISSQAASPPQGVSFYFHFRETWSNFGTCMEENPDLESYVPEVDGYEAEGTRVDDVTRWLLDGFDRVGNENSHREKVERAKLGVEFWREGRSEAKGLSVLIWKEGVRMFIVRQMEESR